MMSNKIFFGCLKNISVRIADWVKGMKKSDPIGRYGTFPWWNQDRDREDIHPDDRNTFIQFCYRYQSVYHCVGQEGGYLLLQFGDVVFRGRLKNFRPLPWAYKFGVGERVRVKNRDPEMIGTIYNMYWHFDRATPLYFLNVNGKKKKRWYFEDEMEKLESSCTGGQKDEKIGTS